MPGLTNSSGTGGPSRAAALLASGVLAFCALMAPGAAAQDIGASASYAVTLGGTGVATAGIRLLDSGGRYAMEIDARISGLASLLASGTATLTSAGISTARGLVSERYDLATKTEGDDLTVRIEYTGKDVTAFVITPPIINNIDRVAIERRHLTDVNDMLAALVLKGGELDAGLCDRRLRIFTGIERFDLALKFVRTEEATSTRTGYVGPTVLCAARYTPISGHYEGAEFTASLMRPDAILVWYAPLQIPGYFIPYRAQLSTSLGDVSVVLTKLDQ